MSAPRRSEGGVRGRRARAVASAAALALLPACASGEKSMRADPREESTTGAAGDSSPGQRPLRDSYKNDPVAGDPTHRKTPVSGDSGSPAPALERTVSLPPAPAVTRSQPALPARCVVALALVREDRLVRPPEVLRRLARALGGDEAVSAALALEVPRDAPAHLGLAELAGAAARQGATLLVVGARGAESDPDRWLLLDAASGEVLALATPAADPAGAARIEGGGVPGRILGRVVADR